MVVDTVLYYYTKKFAKTGQGHFCLVSQGTTDLKAYTKKMMY